MDPACVALLSKISRANPTALWSEGVVTVYTDLTVCSTDSGTCTLSIRRFKSSAPVRVRPCSSSARRSPCKWTQASSTANVDNTVPSTCRAFPVAGTSLDILDESDPGTITRLWSANTTNGMGGREDSFDSI